MIGVYFFALDDELERMLEVVNASIRIKLYKNKHYDQPADAQSVSFSDCRKPMYLKYGLGMETQFFALNEETPFTLIKRVSSQGKVHYSPDIPEEVLDNTAFIEAGGFFEDIFLVRGRLSAMHRSCEIYRELSKVFKKNLIKYEDYYISRGVFNLPDTIRLVQREATEPLSSNLVIDPEIRKKYSISDPSE